MYVASVLLPHGCILIHNHFVHTAHESIQLFSLYGGQLGEAITVSNGILEKVHIKCVITRPWDCSWTSIKTDVRQSIVTVTIGCQIAVVLPGP